MPAELDLQAERAELEAVLSSEAFARSPIVAQMLKYIGERHFSGQSHEIKEYNIAVDAFGRQPNFDQTRDSIVRVEAHRLRKRLQEYYQQQGDGRSTPTSTRASTQCQAAGERLELVCSAGAGGSGDVIRLDLGGR